MKKTLLKYALVLFLLLAGCLSDLRTKQWAQAHLKGKPPATIIHGFLELGFAENQGMVFGILNRQDAVPLRTALTGLRVVILIGISVFIFLHRRKSVLFLIPFLFLWAGAAGNICDVVSAGYVIDFIHIHAGRTLDWPFLFNLADAYLCVGLGMLGVASFLQPRPAKSD